MRILRNLTKQELDYYTSQPTAKKLNERIKRDGITVPAQNAETPAKYSTTEDEVDISATGYELQQANKEKASHEKTEKSRIDFSVFRQGDSNKFVISFGNAAMVSRAVKQGYIEVEGQRIDLSDEVKKQLLATSKQIQDKKKGVSLHNFLLHEAANARQSSDAMKEANDKMSRAMQTASRIMHGRKVSPADEKELMEFNKDLYAMAKSAAALEQHRRKRDDKEDEKISADNEAARAREAEPKDYSVEEMPMPTDETQMTVSLDGEMGQVIDVSAGKDV
ncbi:MAG: hypothetical protein E7203_06275 [Selenomonas ruminantium]|jgi:hypothetical protein|uniref:Uncharacterized protein n=1 Tax=Selenomonas ruminantium TaxID=971 RepID=A0A927WP47_SELRU|nr:hypothetical protein [Selenomonas ruminantium]MBE6085059.1 hypothetical protein [Selenomonas ruminantium]